MTAILCSDLSFSWPDGARVLSGLTLSIGAGRTGLIGVNGSGKSTLLKLIAGELRPDSGTVRVAGDVGYLPQAITLGTSRTVEDLLGITAARDALHAIEAGQGSEDAFAAIGDDWNVEERARAWLDRLGLTGLGPDDRVERLSGGRPSGSRWPPCSCGGRTCCCSTSRPTTSTWTRAGGSTTRSPPGPA
jgi:ATPase subunit of ABC transporter with duplicated ATPase domains